MTGQGIYGDLEADLKAKLDGEVRFDSYSRVLYSTDASNYQIEPVGVVLPRTVEDVITTLEISSKYNVPILPRGGGTSLAGQAVGHALVLDFSKYLNHTISIHPESKTVRVEPGIYLDQLNQRLTQHNLMFGPDPSTARVATVGGVVGNNATGAHSILYGMAGDNIEAAKIVLSDGTGIEFNSLNEESLKTRARKRNTEGRLYNALLELRTNYSDIISSEFPKHWRRASGYSLPYILKSPFNPAQLLASSEGTLAVATEFTLKLVPRPARRGLVLLQFNSLITAMDTVPIILEKKPSAVELIDGMLISVTREHPVYATMLSFVDGDPAAVLAVEFYGESESEVRKKCSDLVNHLIQHSIKCKKSSALSEIEQSNVWSVRKAGLGLLMSRRGDYKPIPCIEDVSVPVNNLSDYSRDILDIINRLGTEAGFYGHASAGCLHVRPLINLKIIDGITLMKELTDEALKLALRYGGVMSGEHGDGLQRSYLNEKLFGPNIFKAMCNLKKIFDPECRLNPGKIVQTSPPDENLRYSPNHEKIEIKSYFDWSNDGGFSGAVEMCNGQGVCRKLNEGIMCPSYMATKDETDTTRARANALRAVLSGVLTVEQLKSDQMHRVFDLCLSCKACKNECPSRVDVAKMKMEFLAHYNDGKRKSLRDSLFCYIHELSRFSAAFPHLANPLTNNWLSRSIFSRMGIHPDRSLPRFSEEKFSDLFLNRVNSNGISIGHKIIYFHDTWVSYFHPEIGMAAVKLLEASGYEVILVTKRVCCGRPMLSKGLLEQARSRARKNVDLLAPYAREGIQIIGTEPSCILTFRDEYPDLLRGDDDARILAENSFLIDEFLDNLNKNHILKINWKTSGPQVLFHGHCHQRAVIGNEASLDILNSAGCSVVDSGAGCCGMAGSFGFELEHYDLSKTIGEDRLFPAVRNASLETIVAVSGVSCHQQIQHFTGKRPRHIAEVLANQINDSIEVS